jgi:hypothetical protein
MSVWDRKDRHPPTSAPLPGVACHRGGVALSTSEKSLVNVLKQSPAVARPHGAVIRLTTACRWWCGSRVRSEVAGFVETAFRFR